MGVACTNDSNYPSAPGVWSLRGQKGSCTFLYLHHRNRQWSGTIRSRWISSLSLAAFCPSANCGSWWWWFGLPWIIPATSYRCWLAGWRVSEFLTVRLTHPLPKGERTESPESTRTCRVNRSGFTVKVAMQNFPVFLFTYSFSTTGLNYRGRYIITKRREKWHEKWKIFYAYGGNKGTEYLPFPLQFNLRTLSQNWRRRPLDRLQDSVETLAEIFLLCINIRHEFVNVIKQLWIINAG